MGEAQNRQYAVAAPFYLGSSGVEVHRSFTIIASTRLEALRDSLHDGPLNGLGLLYQGMGLLWHNAKLHLWRAGLWGEAGGV